MLNMSKNQLLAISPLDGRYSHQIDELRGCFSEYGYIVYRLKTEILWFEVISKIGLDEFPPLSQETKEEIKSWYEDVSYQDIQEIKKIENRINHDVKSVEYFLKNKATKSDFEDLRSSAEFFHFCCTSEDINNLSHSMMLLDARKNFLLPFFKKIIFQLGKIVVDTSEDAMLSRTHGQSASPTTMGKEIANFRARIRKNRDRFKKVEILGKFNGAVGNFNAHNVSCPEIDWLKVSESFIKSIGLTNNFMTTQIEPHDWIAEYSDAVFSVNVILIDLCRDIWGYISSGYFKQNTNNSEVGSSTMPHKVNPIDFENAEGNLGIANALFRHFSEKLPISRFQRDLTDSTVIRNMGVAVSHSILAYKSLLKGLSKISINREKLEKDLENSWEILAEPIQSYMRRFGFPEPYEQLKFLTRGNIVDKKTIQNFIDSLLIEEKDKKILLSLSPSIYIGYAAQLAKKELEKD
jgi:adenylosuccinate lyase